MLDIYFIRHGQSELNARKKENHIVCGRSDHIALSHQGISESLILGRRFLMEGLRFDKIYSSIAVRAFNTARISCESSSQSIDDIVRCEELVEISRGRWEGLPSSQIYNPEIIQYLRSFSYRGKAPGGESQAEVEMRMVSWVEKELLPYSNHNLKIAVFSHQFAIKCLLRSILDSSPKMTYKIILDNTSITRLKYDGEGWHVITLNDTSHFIPFWV